MKMVLLVMQITLIYLMCLTSRNWKHQGTEKNCSCVQGIEYFKILESVVSCLHFQSGGHEERFRTILEKKNQIIVS